jgi:hypothetical protein
MHFAYKISRNASYRADPALHDEAIPLKIA